jgi:glycosyltransferase involved in cell wall biosynthesis
MTDSPRIALFMPSFRGGGAERVMLTIATALADKGASVDVVVAQREGPYLSQVPAPVRVVDLRAGRVLAALPGLTRYLRRVRPQALLSALAHANVVAVWARALARVPVRLVVAEHTTPTLSAAHAPRLRERMLPAFIRFSYRHADAVVAVSNGVAADLAAVTGLERDRILTIYNPIVTPRVEEGAEEPLRHPWFTPGAPPVVLGAGRLTAAKDFPTLLRAFAIVRASRPLRLLILGEGEERPALEALAAELGIEADCSFPGFTANPYAYMARAAVFVLSSRWEGLPTVLVEAMASGCAVVSTDCRNGPREILEDGRHGVLVPVGDPEALARGISATLDAPRRPSAAARARDFSLEAALLHYSRVLGI